MQSPLDRGPAAGAGPGCFVFVFDDPLGDADDNPLRKGLSVGSCPEELHKYSGRVCSACEFQTAMSVYDVDSPRLRLAPHAHHTGKIVVERANIRQIPITDVSRVFAAGLEPIWIGLYAVRRQFLQPLFLLSCVHAYFCNFIYFSSNASDAIDGHATTRLL